MIKFYGTVLVSVFNFFKYWKGERMGYLISLLYIELSQFLIVACIFNVLTMALHMSPDTIPDEGKLFGTIGAGIVWLVVLTKHYTFEKVGEMVIMFADKPDREQTLWGFVAIAMLVAPVFLLISLITP